MAMAVADLVDPTVMVKVTIKVIMLYGQVMTTLCAEMDLELDLSLAEIQVMQVMMIMMKMLQDWVDAKNHHWIVHQVQVPVMIQVIVTLIMIEEEVDSKIHFVVLLQP